MRPGRTPARRAPLVLRVDVLTLRKRHVYSTVPVDIETRRPAAMLSERSPESFRAWLNAHRGVEVICPDRGGCYAPKAPQRARRSLPSSLTGGIGFRLTGSGMDSRHVVLTLRSGAVP